MTPGLLWLLAGVAGCGAEMLLPGVFLLWVGVAACGTGALTEFLGIGFRYQVASFAVLLAALLATLFALRRRPVPGLVNTPDDMVLGRECRAIAFKGASGRVQLGDGSWAARTVDRTSPPADTLLWVVGREGTTLLVAPVAAPRGRGATPTAY